MTGPAKSDFIPRDLFVEAACQQLEVLFHRQVYPDSLLLRGGSGQREVVRGRGQFRNVFSRHLAQQLTRRRQFALRADLRGNRLVERSLRLLHVRDGDQSHFESLLRLLELACNRLPVGMDGCQPVFRRQDVEIALDHAQHQILLRRLVNDIRAGDDFARLP